MSVLGADAVEAASKSAGGAGGTLHVGPRDILTPLAAERARDLGVDVVRAPKGTPLPPSAGGGERPAIAVRPAPRTEAPAANASSTPRVRFDTPPPVPPSPALYRRGAPIAIAVQQQQRSAPRARARASRVVVVGAGHVGAQAATRIAESDLVDEVVLVDVVDGLAAGVALDITHAAGLLGFTTRLRGETTVRDAGRAEITVVTAGRARTPGMSRSDLVSVNAGIVGGVAAEIAATSPDGVILVVSNPLDEMTEHAWHVSGFPPTRVIGMAGVLDTARFRALVGISGPVRAKDVRGWALGSHGDEMVVPLSVATATGRAIGEVIAPDLLAAAVSRTRDSGAEVVSLLKTGSASITPGLAASTMVLAMIRDDGTVLPATVRPTGQYDLRDVYIGLPVRLGRRGVVEIVELPLDPRERAALTSAATNLRSRAASLGAGR